MLKSTDISKTFNQAAANPLRKEARDIDIKALEENRTWELVSKPENTSIIGSKWVYSIKLNSDSSLKIKSIW